MKRHKWGYTPKHKVLDGSVQGCLKCNCTREWVKGKVHYFLNDTVHYKAPECNPKQINQ